MDPIKALIPLIISALVPPLIAGFRSYVARVVPDHWIPILLPIGGGLVAAAAHWAGVDAAVLADNPADPNAFQTVIVGVLSGLAATGVHQVGKQVSKASTPAPGGGQAGFARPMLLACIATLGLAGGALSGCQALGMPNADTFNKRLASGYTTVTAVRNAASVWVDSKVQAAQGLPDQAARLEALRAVRADALNIQKQADLAREGLDVAASLRTINLADANQRLASTLQILQALQLYLEGK